MTHPAEQKPAADPTRLSAARKIRRSLRDKGQLVLYGGFAIGFFYILNDLASLFEDPRIMSGGLASRMIFTMLITLLFYVLLGWTFRGLLEGLAALIDLFLIQVETNGRVEQRLIAILERPAPPAPAHDDDRRRAVTEIRRAIKGGEWDLADELTRAFADDHPDHPEGARLAAERIEARQAAAHDLLAKVEAARGASDADRVIDLRDALRPLLESEALAALDRDLVHWLMAVIQKRMRVVPIQADVVVLVGRVVDRFDGTKEGASLRAALPTLRRSVGLCPRCGEPYAGDDDACPKCLGVASSPENFVSAAQPPSTASHLERPPIIVPDPIDAEPIPEVPSEELEDFRKFLEPPT